MTSAILTYADGFVLMGAEYTPNSGSLSEQYLKMNGTQTSASDLTWSYASVLTMFDARNRTTADSWGAAGLTLSSMCSGGAKSTVTFNVTATTVYGGESFGAFSILLSRTDDLFSRKYLSHRKHRCFIVLVNIQCPWSSR
jgi:glucoamylase